MFVKEAAMPRSFLIKKNNYSHCPLKKRPVPMYKDIDDDLKGERADECSEPENLSTKPQDLSLAAQKAVTPSTAAPDEHAAPAATPPHPQLIKTSAGPLEPLNLNTQAEATALPHHYPHHHHHHYAASPRPQWASPPPHYPPPYFTFNYPYPPPPAPPELYGHGYAPAAAAGVYPAGQLSPYAPREAAASSPPHRPHQPRPYAAAVYPHCGLSPSSPHSAFHSPEDLSSPGSVGSSSSSGGERRGKEPAPGAAPRYHCPDCSKSYSTYSGLTKHKQYHCGGAGAASQAAAAKKSFSCKFCEKVYVSLGALKMHIRTHTLPCKCKLCGKAFSRPWLLQGHIRTHTGEKPFSCPHCHRAFADRSNLRAHLQTHSDVKKYSCPACGKTFSRMSLLAKHSDGGCPGRLSASSPPPTTLEHLAVY
ncbi:zinc finger protein SNAI2-like [Bacillus rossius redtenbacheri]|uniref:zinc finger protein SNAI2-like n=1 Tax=Bacillus rossius redtenbacheri TaxID=93214 RepID=UPI002FDD621C